MSPTARLSTVTLAWLLLAAVPVALPALAKPWLILGAAAVVVMMLDLVLLRASSGITVERRLPGRFALGEPGEVRLVLRNDKTSAVWVEIFDGIPQGSDAPALPWSGEIPANREIRVIHPVRVFTRGEVVFSAVHVRRRSLLGLWFRNQRQLGDEPVKVYPNFEPVIRFALLAMQYRDNPMGIVRKSRPGTSRDFHQLRDYRDGDPFSQIDWKASSRRQTLISRDYQEQRNQSVVFLLDTGRRMRAMDGDLPQFDHILNSILLVAHIALGQGDQISVKSFGGTDRWLPPIKGAHAMPVLLNHLYDYQTTAAPSDFTSAVEQLMARQRRRSLVVLLTNLRGEDGKELLPALQVLKSKHLVLLASMRERVIEETLGEPVGDFGGALKFLAADRYLEERREILAALGASGVLTLDTTAGKFAVDLANSYLDVKAAGRI